MGALWQRGCCELLDRSGLCASGWKVGSLELGRRGEPLERYAEVLGLGLAGEAPHVTAGAE